ncbi:hypothetical protein V8E53_005879 [Lactarius tabidus]
MPGYATDGGDPEAGESVSFEDYGVARPGIVEECSSFERGSMGKSSPEGSSRTGSQKQPGDFDDGANALWSLYGKEAQTHDKARFEKRPLEGTAVDTICRCVRNLFETCRNHTYFESEEARHRRMHVCVEAAAPLLGEVGKLVSEIGHIEKVNQSPTTISDPSFVVRWTCPSLVAVQQVMRSKRLQVLAGYAVSGLTRFQLEYGKPDETGWRSAQRIEECLKTAWKLVEELCQAFEPSTQTRTKKQDDAMEDVDWRISLYRDEMDEATLGLTRQLPGVLFDERRQSQPSLISNIFNAQATGGSPVTPQLIFPGQQVQALVKLSSKLREVLDGQVADGHKEVLESLKSVNQVPLSLGRPDGLMTRKLWRLQDLRDGGGLGYTIELFFLSLRHLLSIPSLHELNSAFYIGTFKIITSHWEESKDSLGTQCILLNLVCDLIIRERGVFSDFQYPEPVTTTLVDMLSNTLLSSSPSPSLPSSSPFTSPGRGSYGPAGTHPPSFTAAPPPGWRTRARRWRAEVDSTAAESWPAVAIVVMADDCGDRGVLKEVGGYGEIAAGVTLHRSQ